MQVVHQAVPPRAVDALGGIPAAFENAHDTVVLLRVGRRHGSSLRHHPAPEFILEPDERRQVGFPRFDTFRVHVVIGGRADIFVAQPQQQMAELVDMDFSGARGVVRGADAVKVENPAATVFLCVRKHIDIIVRHMRRHVAQTLEIGHHLVAFRIEGIETRAAGRIAPDVFTGDGHARIVGGSPHGADVEARGVLLIGRIAEKFVGERAAGRLEFGPLAGPVALRQQDDVHTLRRIAGIHHLERLAAGREPLDKIGIGVDILAETLLETPFAVAGENLDPARTFGIGEHHRFGIGAAHAVGFGRTLPLVEKRAEAAGIDLPARRPVHDAKKLVAVSGRIDQRDLRPCPVRLLLQRVEEILLRAAVSGVIVVEAHRFVEKTVGERRLRSGGDAGSEKQHNKNLLHGSQHFRATKKGYAQTYPRIGPLRVISSPAVRSSRASSCRP